MSAAARKAVSERMKKYWAERRKAQKKVSNRPNCRPESARQVGLGAAGGLGNTDSCFGPEIGDEHRQPTP